MLEVRTTCDPATVEKDVEEDIREFEHWFQSLDNDPLVRSEVAILKTYLFWKLRGGDHAKAGR